LPPAVAGRCRAEGCRRSFFPRAGQCFPAVGAPAKTVSTLGKTVGTLEKTKVLTVFSILTLEISVLTFVFPLPQRRGKKRLRIPAVVPFGGEMRERARVDSGGTGRKYYFCRWNPPQGKNHCTFFSGYAKTTGRRALPHDGGGI
jgi:hypothetical protein